MGTGGSMSDGTPCRHSGCSGQGAWIPAFLMKPQGARKPVSASMPEVTVCEEHKTGSTLDSFLSPEAWTKIEKFLRDNGKGSFLRKNVRLEWRRNQEALPF